MTHWRPKAKTAYVNSVSMGWMQAFMFIFWVQRRGKLWSRGGCLVVEILRGLASFPGPPLRSSDFGSSVRDHTG